MVSSREISYNYKQQKVASGVLKLHQDILKIYLRLTGELKDHFLEIKSNLGLAKNAPVLRLLINDYWKRVMKEA